LRVRGGREEQRGQEQQGLESHGAGRRGWDDVGENVARVGAGRDTSGDVGGGGGLWAAETIVTEAEW